MPSIGITIDAPTEQDAYQIGMLIVQKVQEKLSGPRSGRWYPAPGNKFYDRDYYKSLSPQQQAGINYHLKFTGTSDRAKIVGAAYQASAPGEPPAIRTGRLRQSFLMTIVMEGQHTYRVTVRSNIAYADDLNYGTDRIDPRPFIEPVIYELMPEIINMGILRPLMVFRQA
jgi:hypothetical protein